MEVQFQELATVRMHSATPLKMDELMLLSTYIGRHASRVRVEDIAPEIDVAWLAATKLLGMEEKVLILRDTRMSYKNWQEQCLDMIIQATLKELGNLGDICHSRKGDIQGCSRKQDPVIL